MSIQLIVYPQSFNGQYNSISTTSGQFVVDGTNFNSVNTSSSYDSSSTTNVILDTLTNAPPSIINTWYRFRSTGAGTPTLPSATLGSLTLYSTTGTTQSGIYQKLSNLSVGTTYEITIDISTTGAGYIIPSVYNGTTQITQPLFLANQSQITHTFTATSQTNTLLVAYFNTTVDNIVISNISVQQQGVTPSTTYTNLEDGQVIVDLYEDEDIPLSLSVDDFKNVAEKVQSYSKAFNLPATKRNNQIFDNLFEITRSDDGVVFNAYVKTQCILKQDGFVLFEGYLKLIDIQDKVGEISYNVNLYSEVVALADVLKDKKISDLDFNELNHQYNKDNIKNSWNSNLGLELISPLPTTSFAYNAGLGINNTDVLKYPFVDWTGQITLASNPNNVPGPADGFPELAILEQAFRPCINLKYIIEKIFDPTPFSFTSDFFDTADFLNLFMDFNWGGATTPTITNVNNFSGIWAKIISGTTNPTVLAGIGSFNNLVLFPNPFGNTNQLPSSYNTTTNIITAAVDGENYNMSGTYRIENTSASATQTVECQWLKNTTVIATQTLTISPSSYSDFVFSFNEILLSGDTLQAQFKNSNPSASPVVRMMETSTTPTSVVSFSINTAAITSETLVETLRGELGQWEFLKGIMTMFNLVSVPDKSNPNNILIEPYGDMFIDNANSTSLDWTDKIDVSEMKLTPLTDLNKNTIFKFVEDDEDQTFKLYKETTSGSLYGSKEFDASGFTILEGEKEIIAEPFATTIPKPLFEQFNDFVTPAIFTANDNATEFEGFDNLPRIMYNNGIKTLQNGVTYYIPAQNGLTSENQTQFLQFSHFTEIPTVGSSRDFNFETNQTVTNIGTTAFNLFNLYWLPYFNELYNPDTRTMTLKVNITPGDINSFNFFDTVFIKNREFRVNKIEYKPNDLATVEFILIT